MSTSSHIPEDILEILDHAGMNNLKIVLQTPECDLLKIKRITNTYLNHIYSTLAKQVNTSKYIQGEALERSEHKQWRKLSTGNIEVNRILKGGVLTQGITEVSGQSSCGKTQFCLQLALMVQLPLSAGGLESGAVYICTEDRFPSKRLHQLIKECSATQKFQDIKFGNNIFIEHISDATELLRCVVEQLPKLVSQHRPGLIVIDSVAAVFRADYTQAEGVQRARDLRTLASHLHALANRHNIAVVCVNQVADVGSVTVPALGLAWANLITCRLQMFRDSQTRHLQVVFAPHLPQTSYQYQITASGLV